MRDTLKAALTAPEKGPKVIVASSECMLNKQRRVQPLIAKAIRDGKRVVRERFGVDEDVCTGDHACMRLSGCPSLSVKETTDILRDDPVAAIDQSCVGCGNCGEVAEAAVLCPSFYRADVISNPTGWDRLARPGPRRGDRRPPAPPRRQAVRLRVRRTMTRRRLPVPAGEGGSETLVEPRRRAFHRPADRSPPGHGRAGRRRAGGLDRGLGRQPKAGRRNPPRCRAWHNAPAPRSTTSRCCRRATGKRPIFALMPTPGDVDVRAGGRVHGGGPLHACAGS